MQIKMSALMLNKGRFYPFSAKTARVKQP